MSASNPAGGITGATGAAPPVPGGETEIPNELVGSLSVDDAFAGYTHARKKRRKFHLPGEDAEGLNLTAMMDMMTILLVFLLKNYATEPDRFQVNDKLRPPTSSIEERMEAAVTMVITAEEISVDDERIVSISELNAGEVAKGQMSIAPLQDALFKKAEHLKKLEELGGTPFDGKLLIVAHETTPYELISAALYSAGQAHFSRYQLVVMDAGKQ